MLHQDESSGFSKGRPGNLGDRVTRLERELATANAKIALMERVIAVETHLRGREPSRRHTAYLWPVSNVILSALIRETLTNKGYVMVWHLCEESENKLLARGLTAEQIGEIKRSLAEYDIVLGEEIKI